MSADTYLAARASFSAVKAELSDIVQVIGTVGSKLQSDPKRFNFANQSIGLPMEAIMGRGNASMDAARWPSVERIMQVLVRYHSDSEKLENAWSALPTHVQEGLKPPSDLLRTY